MIGRESGRGTGDGSRVQSVGFLGHASPAVDGGSTDTEDAGDRGRGFALFDEFDGAATAAFEFSRCSFGSHTVLYARPVKKGIFLRAGLSKRLTIQAVNAHQKEWMPDDFHGQGRDSRGRQGARRDETSSRPRTEISDHSRREIHGR